MTVRISLLARAAICLVLICAGCDAREDKPVEVSVIGDPREIAAPLTHVDSVAGQLGLMATARGLVSYDASGGVIPALAQRWIVVDEGRGYIFRLRRAHWINGDKVDAKEVKRLLQARLRVAQRTDPYGSLASVSEILAMTGDVLEIRLATARPNFLVALAQPSMGIARNDGGSGPYRKTRVGGKGGELLLTPADAQNDPDVPRKESDLRRLRAERASKAVMRFVNGDTDLVLGGTLADLPYVTLARIEGRSVRFDPVQGLFGLVLSKRNPMFDDPNVREALSMAIERETIISYFNMSRWKIADRIVPQQLNLPHPPTAPAWQAMSREERRDRAIGTIARWRAQHGGKPVELTLATPRGPGMDLLFLALSVQFRRVGIDLKHVDDGNADLTLIDEVAPYDSVSWYLGRLSCARGVHCDSEAEEMLKSSVSVETASDRLLLLGQAEALVQAHNGFIPLAMPVRWSLVAPHLDGFMPSSRGQHNLRWLLK